MQISEPAEYIILGLLNGQPMHGYELFRQFEGSILSQIVHLEMSQMYAFLKKLQQLTYIGTLVQQQGVRPPRKMHHLTQAGQEVLYEWMKRPDEKPRDIRIMFLIKLYFVRRFLPQETSCLIKQQIEACDHFLEHLESQQYVDIMTNDTDFFNHVVLRSRIHQTHALLDWLKELKTDVDGMPSGT